MSRASRLLALMQCLRRHRLSVPATRLAEELGVSARTVYRDIAALRAEGAPIEGEAGVGYVLRPGFFLPPLMFGDEEIEALVLGLRWASEHGDAALADAGREALAKIIAVMPPDLSMAAESIGLVAGPARPAPASAVDLAALRQAIRFERKLHLTYSDEAGRASERTVWPFALAFFQEVRVLVAWCELRRDFRHFRTDRIGEAVLEERRYPRRRGALLREWRRRQGIPD
jgi:predicted DNA-binding transcriptional regulator YafY